MRVRPFPLGAPLHPSPCPILVLPCASPSTVLTPKSFPGGFQKPLGWGGGVFWGADFTQHPHGPNPRAQPNPFPPCKHFPWDLIFGVILGGFLLSFPSGRSSSPRLALPSREFSDSCIYLFYMGEKKQKPTKTNLSNVLCIQFLGPFSEGREIFP